MMEPFQRKIVDDLEKALKVVGQFRSKHQSIVFTNGCFDLLHSGHLQYLQEARNLGDTLIIGVNDDNSVSLLKGSKRPLVPLRERMEMLAALEMVDLVVPFSEETPARLIEEIKPDILVKGGDYTLDQIVGAKSVLSNGGEVKVLSFKEGISTTDIIEKIRHRYS